MFSGLIWALYRLYRVNNLILIKQKHLLNKQYNHVIIIHLKDGNNKKEVNTIALENSVN